MTHAWVNRSGRHGERDSWAIEAGCSGGGWGEVPDLSSFSTREAVVELTNDVFKGAPDGKIANFAGQLWALRGRIEPGDLMVMPLKTTKQIALGRVTGPYKYLGSSEDLNKRHVVAVQWQRTDLPRSAVKQDLLFTLGSAMSIFSPNKNEAVARLEHLMAFGTDPGRTTILAAASGPKSNVSPPTPEAVDEPEFSPDIEEAARDQITNRIAENFAGHGLASLIAALLEAKGLSCTQSPPGPDGGIDIVAGRGPLGLDDPILVQVKSGGQVSAPVVSQLHGVMATYGARQGLLVAWGGLTKPAQDSLKSSQLRIRVWQAADVVDSVLAHYERLSDEVRSQLPLKRVWMLADTSI